MDAETWLIAVDADGERTTLLVARDPQRKERSFVHTGTFAISHLESRAAPFLREALARASPRDIEDLCAQIGGKVLRRLLPGQRVPHWPVSIRRGAPEGDRLWPFDAELVGLRLGLRRLIRREGLDEAEAAREASYFQQAGLTVRWLGPPHGTLVAAIELAVLAEAADREAANVAANESFTDAARWVGGALGYPSCCVESFVRIRRRDERLLLAEHLPFLEHAPGPPETLWLNGGLTVISHAPCSIACPATTALASRVLGELDRAHPGFAARWRALARRVHAIDRDGAVLALDLEGPLDGGRIRGALELRPPAELVTRDDLAGLTVAIHDHQWTSPRFVATLVADHRG